MLPVVRTAVVAPMLPTLALPVTLSTPPVDIFAPDRLPVTVTPTLLINILRSALALSKPPTKNSMLLFAPVLSVANTKLPDVPELSGALMNR